MKKVLLMLLVVLTAAAPYNIESRKYGIVNGSAWNNSTIDYFAETKPNGTVIFTGCDEGQDLAFRLTPIPGKKGEYRITDENPDWTVNPFNQCSLVKEEYLDDMILLCLYDDAGNLRDVVSPLECHHAMIQALGKRATLLDGEYVSTKGEPMTIEWLENMTFGGKDLHYSNVVFNSVITGVIEVSGGSRMDGLWKVKPTADGLILSKVKSEDEFNRFFTPTGEKMVFKWSRKDLPRFGFASKELLNGDQLRDFDKADLRLMRNEIWFHHGYVPNAEDLREYLRDKQWYTPRASNDGVYDEMSIIEKLNIALIKTAETFYDEWHPVD